MNTPATRNLRAFGFDLSKSLLTIYSSVNTGIWHLETLHHFSCGRSPHTENVTILYSICEDDSFFSVIISFCMRNWPVYDRGPRSELYHGFTLCRFEVFGKLLVASRGK